MAIHGQTLPYPRQRTNLDRRFKKSSKSPFRLHPHSHMPGLERQAPQRAPLSTALFPGSLKDQGPRLRQTGCVKEALHLFSQDLFNPTLFFIVKTKPYFVPTDT